MEPTNLLPLKQAALKLHVNYRQLLDAVNCGDVPTYRLRKGRRLVNLNQIIEIMKEKTNVQ